MFRNRASSLLLLCLLPTVMVFDSVSVPVGDAEHHKPSIFRVIVDFVSGYKTGLLYIESSTVNNTCRLF